MRIFMDCLLASQLGMKALLARFREDGIVLPYAFLKFF